MATSQLTRANKLLQEKVQQLEHRYRTVFDNLGDAILIHDLSGQLLEINQRACDQLGYTREELLQLNLADIDSPKNRDQMPARIKILRQKERLCFESEHVCQDGSLIPVEITSQLIEYGEAPAILSVARGITERKQTEKALRQEHAFRTSIIKDAAEGLCVCHDVTTYPYVEFTVWNDRMAEITGYTMEEINRLGWYQTVYPNPEIRSQAEERMDRMRQGDDLHAERWEVIRADGQKRVLNITTSVLQTSDGTTHVLGLMDDVTEQQRAKVALQESEERFRTLINSMDDVVYTLDRQQRHVGVFGKWVKKQGLTPEYFLDRTAREIMGPENAAVHEAANRRALAGENVIYEWSMPTPSGTNYYQTSVSPLRDSQDEIVGVVGVGRDITANKRAEEAMLRASRLETAATLAGGIAHKINNLMTAAMGYAELVQQQLNDRPDLFKMLATISQSAQQAGDLAQQMLAFAHKGKYLPQPLNLNNTVREVLDLQQRTLPAGIQIEPDLAPDLWTVEADPTQMSQIVLNLLTNAVEAIEDEGKITIVTKQVTVDENLDESLPNLAFGQYVCLSMTDSGHGMSPETLARVFEPFFTTKFQGRGMGLAATFGIVENHGGHISLTSQPGEGTTCKVYLPAIQNGDCE